MSHQSQLNLGSFAKFMPVEKSDRWLQTKVLKLPSQKSVVHPESKVRDLVCLMRAGGAEPGSQQQNQFCAQKGLKGQGGWHRGESQVDKILPKEGQVFLGSWSTQARVEAGGRLYASWGVKYCKGKKNKKGKERRTWLDKI